MTGSWFSDIPGLCGNKEKGGEIGIGKPLRRKVSTSKGRKTRVNCKRRRKGGKEVPEKNSNQKDTDT